MSKFVTAITNFKAGVISEKLKGRADVREYENSLSIGKNALISKQGGGYKRFGLQPMTELPAGYVDSQQESAIFFSDKTAQIMFYGYGTGDVFGRVHDGRGNAISELISFGSGKVGKFLVTAYENYMVIVNSEGTLKPKFIYLNVDPTSDLLVVDGIFDLADGDLFSRPLTDTNKDQGKTIRVVGVNTSFQNRQIEGSFNLQTEMGAGDFVMVSGRTYHQGSMRYSTGMYYINSFASSTVANVTAMWLRRSPANDFDQMADTIYSGGSTVIDGGTANSRWFSEWSVSAWSDAKGWPKAVSVDEGRLVYGGNKFKPASIWASATNEPFFMMQRRFVNLPFSWETGNVFAENWKWESPYNYNGDIIESDPYAFTLATDKGSEVTFMQSSVNFVVGTTRQEFIISGNGAAISAKNITARPHTSHGSATGISITYDNSILYVSRSRQQIFMFRYNEENGSFVSKELTILNPDYLENDKVKSMDWHEELGVAFIITDGGQFLSLAVNNETATAAFTNHEIDGEVLDCAYITEDEEDFLSIIIKRGTRIYMDRMTRFEGQNSLMNSIGDRFDYMDNVRRLGGSGVPTYLEYSPVVRRIQGNVIDIDPSQFITPYNELGIDYADEIIFNSTDPTSFDSLPINLGVPYFVIPSTGFGVCGVGLADDLLDAVAEIGIDLGLGGGELAFNNAEVTYTIVRHNTTDIPMRQFPAGTPVKIFQKGSFTPIVETDIVADGTDRLKLPNAFGELFYGQTYEFHIATSPIEAGQQWGSAQLGLKRVDKVGVRFYKTRSFKLSSDGYNSEEVSFDEPTSGRKELELTGNPEYDHSVHIQNDKAEGCYITSLALRGLSNDG